MKLEDIKLEDMLLENFKSYFTNKHGEAKETLKVVGIDENVDSLVDNLSREQVAVMVKWMNLIIKPLADDTSLSISEYVSANRASNENLDSFVNKMVTSMVGLSVYSTSFGKVNFKKVGEDKYQIKTSEELRKVIKEIPEVIDFDLDPQDEVKITTLSPNEINEDDHELILDSTLIQFGDSLVIQASDNYRSFSVTKIEDGKNDTQLLFTLNEKSILNVAYLKGPLVKHNAALLYSDFVKDEELDRKLTSNDILRVEMFEMPEETAELFEAVLLLNQD